MIILSSLPSKSLHVQYQSYDYSKNKTPVLGKCDTCFGCEIKTGVVRIWLFSR